MSNQASLGVGFTRMTWRVEPKECKCSECDKKIPAGTRALVSLRYGRLQKRVCSDECWRDFDAREWEDVSGKRELIEGAQCDCTETEVDESGRCHACGLLRVR